GDRYVVARQRRERPHWRIAQRDAVKEHVATIDDTDKERTTNGAGTLSLRIPPDLPATIDRAAAGDGDVLQALAADERRTRLLYTGAFPLAGPSRKVVKALRTQQRGAGFEVQRDV